MDCYCQFDINTLNQIWKRWKLNFFSLFLSLVGGGGRWIPLFFTFSSSKICCFCSSSRLWVLLCKKALSSSSWDNLSLALDFSDSRSLIVTSWVIWVAWSIPIWPMPPKENLHFKIYYIVVQNSLHLMTQLWLLPEGNK